MNRTLIQICQYGALIAMSLANTRVLSQEAAPAEQSPTAVRGEIAPATSDVPDNSTQIVTEPAASDDGESAAPGPTRSKSRLIEEVIVTAQKRSENLQDVPISINAFNAGTLDAKGIAGIDSLPSITPGLTINNTAGFSILYLRGVGTDAFLFADPSVAAYIDGVYSPFTQGLGQDLGIVERIEVAKGPQGTLFGRNATGGAINIITRDPGASSETSFQTSYANYNTFKNRIYTNIPVNDSLAVSIAGLYNHAGSYLSGSIDGHPIPDEVTKGVRAKVKVTFSENIDAIVTGSITSIQGIGSYAAPNASPSPILGTALGIQAQDGYSSSFNAPAYSTVDTKTVSGILKGSFDWFDVKLLGSQQHVQSRSLYEFDGSLEPIAEFEPKNFFANFTTSELQIISNASSWNSEWLQYIGGLYYFKGEQAFKPIDLIVGGTDLATGRLFGQTLSPTALALVLPFEALLNTPNGRVGIDGIVDTSSYSAYGQGTVHFNEYVALTVGARYQVEMRDLVRATAGIEQSDGSNLVNYLDSPPKSSTTRSLKPKVSLELRPLDGTLTYISYQQAIKSGTYNPINVLSAPSFAKPEKLDAYEVGLKTEFLGGLVKFNTAAFRYQLKDLQIQFISLLNGGVVSVENAGGSRIFGADFDSTIQILPDLVDNLVITASGAYIPYAKYTSYQNASGYNPQTGIYSQNNDYTGNRTVRTPRFSGNLGLLKTFDVTNGSIEIGGDVYYNSGYAYIAQGCTLSYACQGSYYTLNLRASYLYTPWGVRVSLFGNNVTSEKYSLSKLITDFGANQLLAPPVTYGVRLNWDF